MEYRFEMPWIVYSSLQKQSVEILKEEGNLLSIHWKLQMEYQYQEEMNPDCG